MSQRSTKCHSSRPAADEVPGWSLRGKCTELWCRCAQTWPAAYMRSSISVLTALLLACTFDGSAVAGVHLTKESSCSMLKKTVARLDSLPVTGPPGAGWFCDFSRLSGSRWFVVALRSNRACGGDCSNLMGWYAVNRRNGEIHSYDISKLRVGLRL
jgi:hypothetical protein